MRTEYIKLLHIREVCLWLRVPYKRTKYGAFNNNCSNIKIKETYEESISKGRVKTEDTEPVKRHRYMRQAVSGTMPSQAIATKV